MKSINALLLVSLIATPALPMIKMDVNGVNNQNIVINDGFSGIRLIRNTAGRLSVTNGRVDCQNCTALIELYNGSVKKVVECVQGNCVETQYNLRTGQQISPQLPLNTAEIAPKSSIFGFFSNNPVLTNIMIGSAAIMAGYGLYKLSKSVQKPKNSKKQ